MKIPRNRVSSRLRDLFSAEHTIMSLMAVFVGMAGGLGAVGFRYLINFFQRLAYGSDKFLIDILPALHWSAIIWVPAAGGMIVGPLIFFWAREAKGHGVPEVMEAVALKGGLIRKRIVVIKSLASAICIGTGGSVGREGPIVQIGSAIGSTVGQLFKISADRMRTLVGCGAAAGIAATFNAPIAGAMFALEIVLSDFGPAIFSPIVISAVAATAVSRHFLGDYPAFGVPSYELISMWEFPLYLGLGILCAVVGVALTRLPLMITCIVSALVAGRLFPESIYTHKLSRRGVDIRGGREVNTLKSMRVADVMSTKIETIYEGMTLGVLSRRIAKSKYNSFPVVDEHHCMTGIISFSDYRDAVFEEDLKDLIIAKDLATTDVTTIDVNANLYEALKTIMVKDFAILPVVAAGHPSRLLGVISRRDIIGAYDKAVLKKSLFRIGAA